MSSGIFLFRNRLLINAKSARVMISLFACLNHVGFAVGSTSIAAETVEQDRFEKEVVAGGCNDAVGMDISADGRLVFIERTGAVKLVKIRQQHPQTPNETKQVSRSDIEQIVESPNSLMPEGMLNTFAAEEIADLLAYIRSAADTQHAALH